MIFSETSTTSQCRQSIERQLWVWAEGSHTEHQPDRIHQWRNQPQVEQTVALNIYRLTLSTVVFANRSLRLLVETVPFRSTEKSLPSRTSRTLRQHTGLPARSTQQAPVPCWQGLPANHVYV